MAGMTQGTRTGPRDQLVFAIVLIVIGVAGFVIQATGEALDVGGIIVLLIGLGLLAAFTMTRQYGYLVPGGILTGLGAGIALQEVVQLSEEANGGVIVLGLGLGFVSIWLIGTVVQLAQHHWWPLIPGGILVTVGAALVLGGAAEGLLDYWSVALVILGVVILAAALVQGRSRT